MENGKKKITKWLYWFLFAVAIIVVYKTLDNFSASRELDKKLFRCFNAFYCRITYRLFAIHTL